MELFNFLKVIGKRKWLILTIIVVAFVASFISARSAEIPKEARNVLHFNFSIPYEVNMRDDFRFRIPPEQNAFDFVALFNTEEVIRDGIKRANADISVYKAMNAIDASVQVVKIGGEDERTSFIEVVCRLDNGKMAVDLVNGVTDAARDLFRGILTGSVTETRKFLDGQVKVYEEQIDGQEGKLREFLARHPGFGQTADDNSIATRKVQFDYSQSNLEAEVRGLDAKIRITQDDLEAYEQGAVELIPPALKANASLDVIRYDLLSLQFDRAKLIGQYSEKHPIILKLDSEIVEARDELMREATRLLEEELKVFKAQRTEKQTQLNSFLSGESELVEDTDKMAAARIEYNRLIQDLTIAQDIYGRVKTSLAESINEENKAKMRYSVDIIERATEAQARRELWFQPVFRVAVAVIGAVFIALILAFFVEYISVKAAEANAVSGPSKEQP